MLLIGHSFTPIITLLIDRKLPEGWLVQGHYECSGNSVWLGGLYSSSDGNDVEQLQNIMQTIKKLCTLA